MMEAHSNSAGAPTEEKTFSNVIITADVEKQAPPPSYDSLFGKIKAANENSDSKIGFAKTTMNIVLGSIACTICTGIMLALPIAEIAVGASYLHDCPAQRYIPIYLIVAGSFGVLKGIGTMGQSIKKKKDTDKGEVDEQSGNATNPFDALINLFLFAWFICGNVWVYGLVGEWVSSPSTAGNYCHATVYYFAFWIITVSYILAGVACLVCILMVIIISCCACKKQ